MRAAIFVDYDNLSALQKAAGMLDLVTKALLKLSIRSDEGSGSCEVRIYGGWYEGEEMSSLAQALSVALEEQFPAIVRVPYPGGGVLRIATTAELAMALAEEPAHHLFNTYRKKGRPANVRVQKPEDVGCISASCVLVGAKKLLKSGRCPEASCSVAGANLIYRHEQKIVDTMLACDLVYMAQKNYELIVLVSDDDDFLPPVRTALLRGANIVRIHPNPNSRRAAFSRGNTRLMEVEL